MLEHFIEMLMAKLNAVSKIYYEEAPTNATYPYGVVPTLSFRPLDYGYECNLDIEYYVNELSTQDIDNICDNLRKEMDYYSYHDSLIGFYVRYDDQVLSKQKEQDFTYRRISFIARIF